MNRKQLDLIPDHLLTPRQAGCVPLIGWLHVRGWSMSLLELEQERRRRGIKAGGGATPSPRGSQTGGIAGQILAGASAPPVFWGGDAA